MPAIVVFRHGSRLSIAVIDRRAHKRDAARDVMTDRISIIKDIRFSQPHAAHLRILAALAADTLSESAKRPSNFRELYDAWLNALSVQELNKKFYTELAHWYFWARTQVQFPPAAPKDDEGFQSIAVIRLLTRLIFVWFIKEKGLVPERLFDAQALGGFLKESPLESDGCGYYQAILQNLFFATLNVELGDDERGRARRRWAADTKAANEHYLVPNIYRFSEQFKKPDQALDELFGGVPFLNGGLFECLDRELSESDLKRDPEQRKLATEEKTRSKNYLVLRADGFSRRADSQARVPNRIFFGRTRADLSSALGDTKRSRDIEVKGLLDIFANYKFTVDENTPVEEEVALDPELLGKVFENLLASYNKDTKKNARKQSGSFYTPRVVVDYMVDEALVVAFSNALASTAPAPASGRRAPAVNAVLDLGPGGGDLDLDTPATLASDEDDAAPATARDDGTATRLRHLLGYREEAHRFSAPEVETLISAIEQLKVLDPACGSGAYPMGVLAKLVHVLRKLDPDNRLWRARNRTPLEAQLAAAKTTPDPASRAQRVDDADAALRKFEMTFDANQADYTRKLFLIEKCIHGVDREPIAVQIAKLRFFIALIVEQKKREGLDNFGLTSLPNLETKIVAADSLLSIPRQDKQKSLLDDPRIAEVEEALREASAGYFSARTRRTKLARRERIQQLHDRLCALLQENSLVTGADARRMAAYDPFDQNAHAGFFDVEWMFGMHRDPLHDEGVFDIVIGNPPYVRHEELADYKPQFKKLYECASGTADLYVYFYERSMQLLKPQGALSFITSNKWYRSGYGKALRAYMRSHSKLMSIIDFGDEAVFTALAYPTIVIAQKRDMPLNPPPEADEVLALNWSKEQPVEQFPLVFLESAFAVPQNELKIEGWQLETPVKRRLLQRMRLAGMPLGDYCGGRFYYGIKTGFNDAFIVDGERRAQLVADDPNAASIIRPLLRGRDLKRWRVEFADWHLIRIESSENRKHPWSGMPAREAERSFARSFPSVRDFFHQHRQALVDRYDQGKYFWELRACAYWAEFEQPKIIYPDISQVPQFSWDSMGYYGADTTFFVRYESNHLVALLNSSVTQWALSQISPNVQNGYFRFKTQYCEQLSIPAASSRQQALLSALTVARVGLDPRFEQLINGLVYELFFPDDLHAAGIRLFDACEREHITRLATLQGAALQTEAEALAERIFSNSHPIYAMLFDLQALDVVRIIEARD